jgi:signal transduction histidine kinase
LLRTIASFLKTDLKVNVNIIQTEGVLTNLLNNAVKYSPEGGSITISSKKDRDMAHITVTDTGIGIEPDNLEFIFDEFYMADNSRHDFESSGLGLSICKRIVERHCGKIWVESEGKNKGCSFHFTVPLSENK